MLNITLVPSRSSMITKHGKLHVLIDKLQECWRESHEKAAILRTKQSPIVRSFELA